MAGKPRGVLIAGNWKMNHGLQETDAFFSALAPQIKGTPSALRMAIFAPMLSLDRARSAAARAIPQLAIGSQNTHWEKKGAFTGEISGPMLKELGISWTLVGHSERRQFFGETNESARKRTESLLDQGFTVMLCIGETRGEREAAKTLAVLTEQLAGAIPQPGQGAAQYLDGRLIIAYEPVWAIGTGLTATPEQAEEAHQMIRKLLWDRFGMDAAGRTPILYGGSVTPENITALLACPNIDGALVGGASLKPESFAALVTAGAKAVG